MNLLMLLILQLNNWLYSQKNSDLLMGSIVKSDIWEIDRTKNIEIFKGNVFFENAIYTFKSKNAIYNHNTKEWNIHGNVYSKKKIDEKKYIELECDKAKFNEEKNFGEILSKDKLIIRYYELPDILYISSSKKALIDTKKREIVFYDNFELKISSISAYSNRAIYRDTEGIFEITEKPHIKAFNENYNLYIKAKNIYLDKEKKNIKANENIYGAIYKKEYEIKGRKSSKEIW